jgi:hypothetical protein
MNCEEFERQSEHWMDGHRAPEAREHAMECERCRAMVEDLDAIRLFAPQLAATAAPPERLWTSIRAQLEREGLIHEPGWMERVGGWVRVSARPVATAAAAALTLALIAMTVATRVQAPRPVATGPAWLSSDQPELSSVDTQLDHVERGAIRSLRTPNPAVREALQENLMIIDRQIARCEKTLEQAPSDENTRDYLYDAYQQKAELLNMMAERSTAAAE